jgi:RNase P/RNase MRP subunit POP5
LLKKVKRRYLALTIESDEVFSAGEFMDAVWGAVLKLYGEYGASRTGLVLIDYDAEKRFAVLRTVLTAVDMVRAALALLTRVGGKGVVVHVLVVSGTIRGLYRRLG